MCRLGVESTVWINVYQRGLSPEGHEKGAILFKKVEMLTVSLYEDQGIVDVGTSLGIGIIRGGDGFHLPLAV